MLAEYSRRMPFVAWHAPSRSQLRLRSLSRYTGSLTEQHTRERNQLHAAQGTADTEPSMIRDLKRSLASLERRIVKLRLAAVALVRADDALRQGFDLLHSIPGVAQTSAIHLLAELGTLPPGLSVRQWVAHSGLDPVHQVSGTSVSKPSKISRAGNRHLRRALYMPALVGCRFDPHLKAFYHQLLNRHKARMQALIAVARKILHAVYGILKTNTPYNGAKLFPEITPL